MWILATHSGDGGMAVSGYGTENEARRALRAYLDPDNEQAQLSWEAFEAWAQDSVDVDFLVERV